MVELAIPHTMESLAFNKDSDDIPVMRTLSELASIQFKNNIRNRMIVNNQNWLCVIIGKTGSGKSYAGMSIGEEFNGDRFTARNVLFNPIEFLNAIKDYGNIKKGDIFVFDEAGVNMSARNWQSVQNKILGIILQTFRFLNIGVIFTVPDISFVDVQARKLFHHVLETQFIDKERQLCYLVPREVVTNLFSPKIFYKYPRVKINGKEIGISGLYLPKPSKRIIDEYEERKQEFGRGLIDNAHLELNEFGEMQEYQKERGKKKRQEFISKLNEDNRG